jgi:hypothetical protein
MGCECVDLPKKSGRFGKPRKDWRVDGRELELMRQGLVGHPKRPAAIR